MGVHRKRTRRPVTDAEYNKMMRRMVEAWHRRVLAAPDGNLAELYAAETSAQELAEQLRTGTNLRVYLAQQNGLSYNDIAKALGMTKAAVIKRAKLGEQATRELEATMRAALPRELPPGSRYA